MLSDFTFYILRGNEKMTHFIGIVCVLFPGVICFYGYNIHLIFVDKRIEK